MNWKTDSEHVYRTEVSETHKNKGFIHKNQESQKTNVQGNGQHKNMAREFS